MTMPYGPWSPSFSEASRNGDAWPGPCAVLVGSGLQLVVLPRKSEVGSDAPEHEGPRTKN
jgi:hypothetical protein